MKILIICIPRSGSTVLTDSLSTILKSERFQEPFNYAWPTRSSVNFPFKVPSKCVVKCIVSQSPMDVNNSMDFFQGYARGFDKIILLSRKNTQLAYESFRFRNQTVQKNGWHDKYMISEPLEYSKEDMDFISSCKVNIETLSESFNIPITWYEDLYSGDKVKVTEIIKKWQIDINFEEIFGFIDPKKKYRITKNNTII